MRCHLKLSHSDSMWYMLGNAGRMAGCCGVVVSVDSEEAEAVVGIISMIMSAIERIFSIFIPVSSHFLSFIIFLLYLC